MHAYAQWLPSAGFVTSTTTLTLVKSKCMRVSLIRTTAWSLIMCMLQ
jgi:hypothetical protein